MLSKKKRFLSILLEFSSDSDRENSDRKNSDEENFGEEN